MAYITRFPLVRHLRSEPSRHVLHYAGGRLKRSGRGLAYWFRPLPAAIAEVPVDDRELPFLFHGRSRDYQDVTVQGVITWRVADPEALAARVDFSIDLASGCSFQRPRCCRATRSSSPGPGWPPMRCARSSRSASSRSASACTPA